MVFSSISFLFYFLPLFLFGYHFCPFRWKNICLVFFSLFFYAWGEPKYVLLMLLSIWVDYSLGNGIGFAYRKNKPSLAFVCLILSIVVNLSLLIVFKYSGLLISTLNQITPMNLSIPNLLLPIGISFYTFQTMSYTIDVYRKQVKPQKNLWEFATYVTLFPQLIAGPIVRYHTIEKELHSRTGDYDTGVTRFIIGLSQKVLLANTCGLVFEQIRANTTQVSLVGNWLGLIFYAFQIYFDFAGYSSMAIGLGRLLGFHFPENFNYPYISKSITEFWRRWHISLSTWFREYVYIPLGGNRRGLGIQIRNILVVWLLTGIWHGASWNFLLWGLYFGLLLIIEKLFLLKKLDCMPAAIGHIYSLFAILIGWVFFAFEDFVEIIRYVSSLFYSADLFIGRDSFLLRNNFVLFLLSVLFSTPFPNKLFLKAPKSFQHLLLIIVFVISVAYIVDSTYNPFLYFRF